MRSITEFATILATPRCNPADDYDAAECEQCGHRCEPQELTPDRSGDLICGDCHYTNADLRAGLAY